MTPKEERLLEQLRKNTGPRDSKDGPVAQLGRANELTDRLSDHATDDKKASMDIDPSKGWIARAIEAVPSLRYVLAVSAVAALGALARSFAGGSLALVLGVVVVMIALAFTLLFFSHVVDNRLSRGISIDLPITVIMWMFIITTCVSGVFATTSLWFGVPLDWRPASHAVDTQK